MVDFPSSPNSQFMTALYTNDFGTAQSLLLSNQIASISYQTFMLIIQKGVASIIEMTLRDPRVQAYVALGAYEAVRWTAAFGHLEAMDVLLRLRGALDYVISDNEAMNIAIRNGHVELANRLAQLSQHRPITPQYDATHRPPLKRGVGQMLDPINVTTLEDMTKRNRPSKPGLDP